ncbi:MAG TPA: D-aminoacylase [Thermoanaerobaculia bacterium]|nr:D-aminoacylase [Thermoanaerobaculia bacterium]
MRRLAGLAPASCLGFAAVVFLALSPGDPAPAPAYDLVLTGGRVVDGTGAPWFSADVAVRDGKIAAVGKLAGAAARRTLDATGLVVAPGFIDLLGQSEYNVLVDPRAASKITQGITTEVTGEGDSIAPIDDKLIAENQDAYRRYGVFPDWRSLDQYFATLSRRGAGINLATFVGSGSVRALVVGRENRKATPEELARMEQLVDQAMKEGALGVSSSLQYIPNIYSSTEELIALARVAARYGGAYFTHQRSESGRIDASLDEVFRIAKEAGIRTQVWHLKTAYKSNFGRMPEILKKIEDARARGIDVAANQYPWNRASNGLDACLPPWVREGGREKLLKRLADPAIRERVKADMATESSEWENQFLGAGSADGVMVAEVLDPKLKPYEGRTVASIAAAEKKDPRDVVIDIVQADRANASCIIAIMDERDVRAALASPLVSFGTDSPAKATDGPLSHETSHPRGWGSAARILGYYVREEKVLRLEEAIRKMTSFAAEAAGLPGRGLVKPGFAADLVVFDPETVGALATFEKPNQYSQGFRYVAVNGVLVVDEGKLTGKTPGQPLRGPGYKGPKT